LERASASGADIDPQRLVSELDQECLELGGVLK
jgi:hypothetical protein